MATVRHQRKNLSVRRDLSRANLCLADKSAHYHWYFRTLCHYCLHFTAVCLCKTKAWNWRRTSPTKKKSNVMLSTIPSLCKDLNGFESEKPHWTVRYDQWSFQAAETQNNLSTWTFSLNSTQRLSKISALISTTEHIVEGQICYEHMKCSPTSTDGHREEHEPPLLSSALFLRWTSDTQSKSQSSVRESDSLIEIDRD